MCFVDSWGMTNRVVSLIPRPLPDFILQLWRKSGEGLVLLLCHGPEMLDLVSL